MKKGSLFAGILGLIQLGLILICVYLMVYGIYKYPAAPIRNHDGKFFDKQRREYTSEEYQKFNTWEQSLFWAFGIAIGGNFIIYYGKKIFDKSGMNFSNKTGDR